jgi:hypothetical protein
MMNYGLIELKTSRLLVLLIKMIFNNPACLICVDDDNECYYTYRCFFNSCLISRVRIAATLKPRIRESEM